jgi:hypothetical protein
MNKPTKTLPPGYIESSGVSLKKTTDLLAMLIWSLVLPALTVPLIIASLRLGQSGSFTISITTPWSLLTTLGGILLTTVAMVIIHEGLHGLVFWLSTHEMPRFEFKFYYASASPGDWFMPRSTFLIATLLPLVAITLVGLLLLPVTSSFIRYMLILLVVFNASGCAGDMLVALRLLRLPVGTLSRDTGSAVSFFTPAAATSDSPSC